MKNTLLLILGLIFSLFLQAQTPQTYVSFYGDTLNLYKYEGERIMLLAKTDTFDIAVMKKWTDALDDAYDFYKKCTGHEPYFFSTTYINQKLTIASVPETCGAGCGNLGATGIELLDDFFDLCYTNLKNENKHEQIIFYELGRNFWIYAYRLSYMPNDPVTTGFAVFMRFMSMKYLEIDDYPTHVDFENKIREQRTLYLANDTLNWSNTLALVKGVPGSPWSAADLFASFCMYLEETYGMEWVQKVWNYAWQRPIRTTTQGAVDNFVIASSQAANTNLVSLFQEWRWYVSQTAIEYIDSLRLGEPTFYLDDNGVTIKCINCVPGDTGTVSGILYEAVDKDLLIKRRNESADLSKLCTSLVTDMSRMFEGASAFNQGISSWDVSNVLKMDSMFLGAFEFNKDIGKWDVGSVYTMEAMFGSATNFNQNIGDWDVKNVSNMSAMFFLASSFNQNLNNWCVSKFVTEPSNFSDNSALLEKNKPIWGNCPYTYIPDDNFEQALIDLGYDSGELDDYVLTVNIESVTFLDISNRFISDLTGIEDFTSLEKLYCRENHIKELNITQNTSLIVLDCAVNPLLNVDISHNALLEYFDCNANLLTNIDISHNTNLTFLSCSGNKLENLDVAQNIELFELWCSSCNLTNLNLSNNVALYRLNCAINKLSNLDLSQNTSLGWLNCGLNSLTSLDVSQNTLLIHLYTNNNQLTHLDVSQNDTLKYYSCENNRLTFESLKPAMGIASLSYSPQDSVGTKQFLTKTAGENYSYYLEVGGENNIYKWYKNDVLLSSQTSATLNLTNVKLDDAGVYRCEVTNSVVTGLTLYSRKITLIVNKVTYVGEIGTLDNLNIYPNPANDVLFIETPSSGNLKIYDINGKMVLNKNLENLKNEIDISELVAGTYLLRFDSDGSTKTLPLIKK